MTDNNPNFKITSDNTGVISGSTGWSNEFKVCYAESWGDATLKFYYRNVQIASTKITIRVQVRISASATAYSSLEGTSNFSMQVGSQLKLFYWDMSANRLFNRESATVASSSNTSVLSVSNAFDSSNRLVVTIKALKAGTASAKILVSSPAYVYDGFNKSFNITVK